ncbi:hypothetical protein GGTG_01217 [Gaeumannomyces tritici R3-111a-1]|uniref:Uncharacterized protein n=1 Tax=Gaeumannomyces tritici (strain R3-111a-1) TaxID=644352 RepID=J3NIY3_GAET3|nr:hypothetical protein GGTG_01217 [Gaeumannomyces tritici R3-111a-1]EJT81233.1 hypothetical protein GGTG_01217 [Gaeumannomyces tritici R3-111a-1]
MSAKFHSVGVGVGMRGKIFSAKRKGRCDDRPGVSVKSHGRTGPGLAMARRQVWRMPLSYSAMPTIKKYGSSF